MTMFFTTSGATVGALPGPYVSVGLGPDLLAGGRVERDEAAFAATKKTLPWATATPRFTLPQHRDTSKGPRACTARSPCPSSRRGPRPSRPSPDRNMIPSTTIGVASNE
jgi:hypothetical protein